MSDKDEPSDQEIADVLRGLDPQPNTLVRNFEVEFERVRCCSCDISFYVTKFGTSSDRKTTQDFIVQTATL